MVSITLRGIEHTQATLQSSKNINQYVLRLMAIKKQHPLFHLDSYPDEKYPEFPKCSGVAKCSWLITFVLNTSEKFTPPLTNTTYLNKKVAFPSPTFIDPLSEELQLFYKKRKRN